MNLPFWSLRNKTEDIERALARGDSMSARLAAYELGVRLSHTVTATQEHAESSSAEGRADAGGQVIERVLSLFGAELDHLIACLKTQQVPCAAEVVQRLFVLLNELDRDALSADAG